MVQIIDRSGWDARSPRDTPIATSPSELYLHHSVGSGLRDKNGDGDLGDDYMRTMQNYHMDSKGWSDIAYNHAHDPDGSEFYEGRGFGIRPGAQKRHNSNTHALVIMGDFRKRKVTDELIANIASFYVDAIKAGLLPDVPVLGHRQAPNQSTTCPGTNLMTALADINQLIRERNTVSLGPNGEPNWDKVDNTFKPAWTWAWTEKVPIISKFSDPKDTVTKEELMVMLHRDEADEGDNKSSGGLTEAKVKQMINQSRNVID